MIRIPSPQAIVQDLSERARNDVNAAVDFYRRLARLARWLYDCANSFFHSRFFSRYGWSILPFIVIVIFQAQIHMNYGAVWLGDSEPDQANNVGWIMRTGQMPPPPAPGSSCGSNSTCEAYQPPLYYEIMAVPADIATSLFRMAPNDAIAFAAKPVMFLFSVLWLVLVIQAVQLIMPRSAWIPKALVACAAVLIAQVVLIESMVINDLPASIAGLAAVLVLYLILRTRRKLKWVWWIAAAALIGLSAAFKYTGSALLLAYGLTAVSIGIGYLIRRYLRQLRTVALSALVGLPFMLVPYLVTVQHLQQYFPANITARDIPGEAWDGNMATFLGTFSTDIFGEPMWGLVPNQPPSLQMPGLSSFWSLQYVSLFADYGNRWVKPIEFSLPPDQLKANQYDGSTKFYGTPIGIARFNSMVLLTVFAAPIALLMLIGLISIAVRLVIHPRRVMRDGTLVILLVAVITIGSFALNVAQYYNRAAFTQPREAAYVYILLLIAGAGWLQRLRARRLATQIPIVAAQTIVWTLTVVFIGASCAFFWINSA